MKLLNSESKEVQLLDLGIVKAGELKTFTYYLLNDSIAKIIDIAILIMHNEIELVTYPKTLVANEKGEVVFNWKPSLTVKKGLKTLVTISGTELWE